MGVTQLKFIFWHFFGQSFPQATKRVTDNVSYAKDLATETVSNTVLSAQGIVTTAHEKVTSGVVSRTQHILGKKKKNEKN